MYLYNADPESPEWIAYQDAMEEIILEGLIEAVRCSLAYLADHTDKSKVESPLMQGSLIIEVSDQYLLLLLFHLSKVKQNSTQSSLSNAGHTAALHAGNAGDSR